MRFPSPSACQGTCLACDAFHKTPVACSHEDTVVDDVLAGLVEVRGHLALGNRHTDCIRNPLSQRPCGRLHPGRDPIFRMPRALRTHLTKRLYIVERQIEACHVEQRIEKHRAVTSREHETIPIEPRWIPWIVLELDAIQEGTKLGGSHRHAGVAGICLLDRIDGQTPHGQRNRL